MNIAQTQTSSKARVKEDSIGEDRMKNINSKFVTTSIDEFRKLCIEAIEASSGKPATKLRFTDEMKRAPNKAKMLFSVTNYFLAGEGKGV
jgi:hypothetical protein